MIIKYSLFEITGRTMLTFNILIVVFISAIKCDATATKPTIYKCCEFGQYVGIDRKEDGSIISKKACMNGSYDMDNIMIYDIDRYTARKDLIFSSTFNVIPGIFNSNEKFRAYVTNSKAFKDNYFFVTENAILNIETPNTYVRWMKLEQKQFCVDYYMNINATPAFWLIFPEIPLESRNVTYLTAAMFVSSFFLLLVLIVYSLLHELRNMSGQILMAYVASLLTGMFLLAILRAKARGIYVCYCLTLVIYFSFLASFCWMNVMSYDIWWTFRGYAKARPIHRRGKPFKYLMYSLYAWGLPLAMTIMLVTLDQSDLRHKPWIVKPSLQKSGSFIEGGEKLYYLYCPMLILICANWMFFLMTAFNIWRLSRGTSVLDSAAAGTPAAHRSNRQRFLVYLKLSVVMGLNWVLEVARFFYPIDSLWVIGDYYNMLIGLSIFLIFVCKRKIFRKLTKVYLQCKNRNMWNRGSNSRNNTSSEGSSGTSGNTESETLKVCANPKGPGYVISNNF